MTEGPWVQGAVVALALTQFLIVWYLYRRSTIARGPVVGAAGAEDVETDPDTVVCTECGTPNEAEYQFCRDCTAELPGPATTAGFVGGARGSDPR